MLAVEAGVAEIGGELRRARLARKLSIEDVSRATKINPSLIRAIENEDFAKLPGGLFTRGFLRAYARHVGLEPEEMVDRYRAEFEAPPARSEEMPAQPADRVAAVKTPVAIDDDTVSSRRIQILQLSVILLTVALYFAVSRRPQAEVPSDAKPVEPIAVTPKAETPVATNGTAASEQNPLTLVLQPQGPCWVEATAEGQRVFGKLMDAGQTATLTIREDVMLRVGEPGAFAFTIDNVPGRLLGQPGLPVTVTINRGNYKTFLKSQG